MNTPSVAEIDTLNSLLEAEINSIFHFVGEGSPYLAHASLQMRRELESMRQHLDQYEHELAGLIRRLGGEPAHPPKPSADEQYLSYLSLKFLLPKLVDAKELMLERYKHALRAIGKNSELVQMLKNHMTEMRVDLEILKQVAAQVKVN